MDATVTVVELVPARSGSNKCILNCVVPIGTLFSRFAPAALRTAISPLNPALEAFAPINEE